MTRIRRARPTSPLPAACPYTRNRGHGTGTIGILAGHGIGAAPGATILPIQIADSVARFETGTMAQGFAHALQSRAHVLSTSMGGLASQLIADIVNDCCDAGFVMVSAAGNSFGQLPIASILYPARMRRVVAACGIMADSHPYADLPPTTMERCYGPASKMPTALAGYTPTCRGRGSDAPRPSIRTDAAPLPRLRSWPQGGALVDFEALPASKSIRLLIA